MDKVTTILGTPSHTHVTRNVKVDMYNGTTRKQLEAAFGRPNHSSRPDVKGNSQMTWYLDDGRVMVHHVVRMSPTEADKFAEYTVVKNLKANESVQTLSLLTFLTNE